MALMPGLALGALIMPAQAQTSAQGESLACVPVSIPQAVEAAGIVMLEIAIARVRTPNTAYRGRGGLARRHGGRGSDVAALGCVA